MTHTVNEHFEGRSPIVREIYDTILAAAGECGPLEQDPKKTSIHLNRRSAFAAVKTRREFLILTVKAIEDIDSARISKREQLSAHRWYHEIKIGDPKEIDTEIIEWLRKGYDLSG